MRVSIFDRIAGDRLEFRAEADLASIMAPRGDAYCEALDALDATGSAHAYVDGSPEVLLIRTGTDTARERRVLLRQIALRAQRAVDADRAAAGLPPIDARALAMALTQAEDMGCRLRLRDLAAADDADVLHDVLGIVTQQHPTSGAVDLAAFRPRFLESDDQRADAAGELPDNAGICAVDLDECTVTIALDSADQVTALRRRLPARSRVQVIDPPADAGPSRAEIRARDGRSRMELHRMGLSLEAIAAGAAPPWHLDETDTADDGFIVIRDADNGYVCELNLGAFKGRPYGIESEDRALRQARDVARLICAAVIAQVPGEALAADMAELAEGAAPEISP